MKQNQPRRKYHDSYAWKFVFSHCVGIGGSSGIYVDGGDNDGGVFPHKGNRAHCFCDDDPLLLFWVDVFDGTKQTTTLICDARWRYRDRTITNGEIMSEWRLVPPQPTPEMVEAAKDNRASQPPGTLPGSAMRQMFEAMVRAAPPLGVEPVLYQMWHPNFSTWVNCSKTVADTFAARNEGHEIRPLYTRPSPPSELLKEVEELIQFHDALVAGGKISTYGMVKRIDSLRSVLNKETPNA